MGFLDAANAELDWLKLQTDANQLLQSLHWPNWQTFGLSALVLMVTVISWRRFFSPISNIPGPALASITRLWHAKHIIVGDQNLQLAALHEKHGYFVRMAPNEVSISHPDGVRRLLLQPLPKGHFYNISSYPDWRFQTPMSTLDPKQKVERSKNFASAYALSNVVQYEDSISRIIEKLFMWMDKYAASHEPMKLDEFFTFTTFDVVGEAIFSKEFGFIETGTDIGNSIANNLALEAIGTWVAQFQWMQKILGSPIVTWLGLSPGSMLFRTTKKALDERQKNPDARFDMVAHWFRRLDEHPDRVTLRDIHAQATTNVGAGSDTVSCGLQSVVYHMIRQPATWQRARAEIDAAMKNGLCHDKVISFADAQKLPYLQACIKEGLRVHSPVPMGLPRVAPKGGVTVGDRSFPEGTIVTVSPWVMHHSKEIWGPDASQFNPDRWLKPDSELLDKYFLPFGAGYMSCPGQHMAKMELSKICATAIRDYDIRQVDPTQEWKWKAYFTFVPHSWPVNVSKRS